MSNIAIDLTSTPKNKTGIGRYLYNLIHSLQKVDKINHYYLLIQDDDIEGFNLYSKNFNIVPVKSKILRKTYIRILWEQFVLPSILKSLSIDLLHSPNFTIPYFSKVKKIVTFHDMTYFIYPNVHTLLKRELFKLYIRLSSDKANAIISISHNTELDIIKYTNSKLPIFVTPLGVDWRFYANNNFDKETLKQYGIDFKYFLYVGTIEPRKNLLRLIKAYNMLDLSIKDEYKLVICGKRGWMYSEIYEYIQSENLESYIHFTDYVKDEHLPLLYKNAILFLYVSIYEGFGIPIIESMSCGTPTITSNTSSMAEISGDSVILIDPYNEESIKNAILNILQNENVRETLIHKGPVQAKKYTWDNCAKLTVEAYNSI